MYKKTLILLSMLLVSSLGLATNTETLIASEISEVNLEDTNTEAPPCDCDIYLEPTFTWATDPETCTVKFLADPGNPCVGDVDWSWSVNGGTPISTGTDPIFLYETLDNMESLELIAFNDEYHKKCTKRYFKWLEPYTCANTSGGVTLIKDAFVYPSIPIADGASLYVNQNFTYVIEISNMTSDVQFMEFSDTFEMSNGFDAACVFSLNTAFTDIIHNGVDTGDDILHPGGFDIPAQFITILPGTTTLTFPVTTSSGSCVPHSAFKNCAKVESIDGGGFVSEECSILNIRYGCPMGLTDGRCLEPGELVEGETVLSKMTGHTPFFGVEGFSARLFFDHEQYDAPDLILHPIVAASNFELNFNDIAPGVIDFEIVPTVAGATFNIGAGGTYSPMSLKAILLSDLVDCSQFMLHDIFLTSGGITQSIYIDPGVFCEDFPSGYEEVTILVDEGLEACASILNPLELTAIGPFESQDPSIQYDWSNGATTQTITITTGGEYFVDVTGAEGCIRSGSITIETCEVECECGAIEPEIVTIISKCDVYISLDMPVCADLEGVTYKWIFSNGNSYVGIDPPVQSFAGPTSPGPEITLKMYYYLNGEYCEEVVFKDIFVPCRSSGLKMFPNPANDNVQIEIMGDQIESGSLRVLNTQGMVVLEEAFSLVGKSGPLTCDVKSLTTGLYFVQLIDSEGSVVDIKRLAIR